MMQKAICVLGMHRSGTSCLAGSIEAAGVFMGNISLWNRHNTKGNREHHEIVAMHDRLLADNGAAWNKPVSPILWGQEHRHERDRILTEFRDAPCWGFKDPRTVLTFEGWLEAVPDLQFAGTFRHPLAVADSLKIRSKLAFEQSVDLWTFYNRRILQEFRRRPFPIICFDLPPDQLLERFSVLFKHFDLRKPDGGSVFFDEGLKHFDASKAGPLPDDAAALYAELRQIAF